MKSSVMGPWHLVYPGKLTTRQPNPVGPSSARLSLARLALSRLALDWQTVLDFLLPPRCAACDEPVAVQGDLCPSCFGETHFISAPLCDRCGVPLSAAEQGGAEALCPVCRQHPPRFRQARASLRYDIHGRRLILPLKHGDRLGLAAVLAPMIVRAASELLVRADVLVPVPLHRQRLFHRKYNQAAVLAFAIGRLAGKPVLPDGMQRLRATAPLEDRSPEERAREVTGSVSVRPSRAAMIAGRTVLLVDDVMTSGATANACAEALLRAGAAAVDVVVAARVPDPRLK